MMDKIIQDKADKLADLKIKIKAMDAQAKKLSKELIASGVACDIMTPDGKLAFSVRESFATVDKLGIIKMMGQKAYNAHSTISKKGVVDGIGQSGFQDALDKGFMAVKSISEFFTLR